MFKVIVAVLCLSAVIWAVPRSKRQLLGDVDVNEIKAALSNKATVDTLLKCVTATDSDAETICSKRGKLFRNLTPKVIKKADCPSACTDQEKQLLAYVYKKIKTDYSDGYQALKAFYKDITPDDWAKFESWMDTIPSL